MELSLKEQQLLADFRQLSTDLQNELLLKLTDLRRYRTNDENLIVPSANQCAIKTPQDRPQESDSDQLITE